MLPYYFYIWSLKIAKIFRSNSLECELHKSFIKAAASKIVIYFQVEPKFLVSFLDSSIESLKQSKDTDINGIISKEELIQRLIERKDLIEESIRVSEVNVSFWLVKTF